MALTAKKPFKAYEPGAALEQRPLKQIMPSVTTWKYVQNQFAVCTTNNRKRMQQIIADHLAKITPGSNDAAAEETLPHVLEVLRIRTEPLAEQYNAAYDAWLLSKGQWKGATEVFTHKMGKELREKLSFWDARVQVVFMKGSIVYRRLLPYGRKAFTKGSYEQRLEALESFKQALSAHEILSSVQQSIEVFLSSARALRNQQLQLESQVESRANAVTALCEACTTQLYGNLGLLMDTFRTRPEAIGDYFDLDTLRKTSPGEEDPPAMPYIDRQGFVITGE